MTVTCMSLGRVLRVVMARGRDLARSVIARIVVVVIASHASQACTYQLPARLATRRDGYYYRVLATMLFDAQVAQRDASPRVL